jgi:hypothetical protein
MHPIGIIPRDSRQWRYRPNPATSANGSAWYAPEYREDSWSQGQAPFRGRMDGVSGVAAGGEFQFRHHFKLSPAEAREHSLFLQILSRSPALSLWINGVPLLVNIDGQTRKLSREKEEWNFEIEFHQGAASGADLSTPANGHAQRVLRAGANVLAISAAAVASKEPLLELGLYQYTQPVVQDGDGDPVSQQRVMNRAVVCDMCSSEYGSHPACVQVCPHDAAIRVDARKYFTLQ